MEREVGDRRRGERRERRGGEGGDGKGVRFFFSADLATLIVAKRCV